MANQRKYSDEVKTYIISALACWDTPSTVAQGVRNTFGLEVTRQQVQQFDPTKSAGRNLCAKWTALFYTTREQFQKEIVQEPVAQRAVRIRRLGRMAEHMEDRGNVVVAASLYEQIAKEVGGGYNQLRLASAGVGAFLGPTLSAEATAAAVREFAPFFKGSKVNR